MYLDIVPVDTIYKVYMFDSSDKSRAVQEDGLAGTLAPSRSSIPKRRTSTYNNLRQERLSQHPLHTNIFFEDY